MVGSLIDCDSNEHAVTKGLGVLLSVRTPDMFGAEIYYSLFYYSLVMETQKKAMKITQSLPRIGYIIAKTIKRKKHIS